MKTSCTCRCLIGIFLIISGLLISAGPAAAWSDSSAHYAVAGCGTHVNTPTQYFQGASYSFILCRAGSGATSWMAQILNNSNQVICSTNGYVPVPPTPLSFTCTGLPLAVTLKAKVFWYVGNSPLMEHIDNFKRTK